VGDAGADRRDHRRHPAAALVRQPQRQEGRRDGRRIDNARKGRRHGSGLHGRDGRRQLRDARRPEGQSRAAQLLGHVVSALPAGADPRADGHHRPLRRQGVRLPARIARRETRGRGGVPRKDRLRLPDGTRPRTHRLRPLRLELHPAELRDRPQGQGRAGHGRLRRT